LLVFSLTPQLDGGVLDHMGRISEIGSGKNIWSWWREKKQREDGENEGPYYLCMLFMDINEIISLKIMIWVGHAAHVMDERNSYTILSKNVKRRNHSRDYVQFRELLQECEKCKLNALKGTLVNLELRTLSQNFIIVVFWFKVSVYVNYVRTLKFF